MVNVGWDLETGLMASELQQCTCMEPEGSTWVERCFTVLSARYTAKAEPQPNVSEIKPAGAYYQI